MPPISTKYPPVAVKFRFSHQQSLAEASDSNKNRREAFWLPFQSILGRVTPNQEITIDILESRIKYGFGRELQQLLERRLGLERGKRALAGALLIRTIRIDYSSLIIDTLIEPAGNLIKLFDGDFEIFERFLSVYALDAFDLALNKEGRYYGVALSDLVTQMSVAVDAEPRAWFEYQDRTENSMTQTGDVKPPGASVSAKSKATWLWVLSNTSLVVPALAIGFFAWSAIKAVDGRSKEVDSMYKDLIKEQKSLIDSELLHVQKLSAALDSTRQIRKHE
jgi:hypothetical protein